QVGPSDLDELRTFWAGDPNTREESALKKVNMDGFRLRSGERLCAVALVKRFAAPAALAKKLGLHVREDLGFEDVSSIAAAKWFEANPQLRAFAEKEKSSSWLHWSRPDQGKEDGDSEVDGQTWSALLDARKKESPPA